MENGFRGGLPYSIDVRRLKDRYPVETLTEGLIIQHADLEGIVNCKAGTQRYYGVINSWISSVKNSNGIIIIWQPSVGLKILEPSGTMGHVDRKSRQKARQFVSATRIFGWVDRNRLNSAGQARLDHQMQYLAKIASEVRSVPKELAVDIAPVLSLPKPKLVPSKEEKAS